EPAVRITRHRICRRYRLSGILSVAYDPRVMQITRARCICLLIVGVAAVAGPRAAEYLTEGVDQARTGWVRDEKLFSVASVGNMKLLWKLKLESTPRAMHNLFA